MVISLYSPKDSYDANFLINYCGINLRDQFLRIPGIAQVDLFGGTDYGMRIWFKPDKLAKLGLTPADVISAIKEQNLQAPAGKVGGAPTPKDQLFTETLSAPGRLVTPEEFENIIVRQTRNWRGGPDQRHRSRRTWLAGLQLIRTAEWQTGRRDGGLPACRAPISSRPPRRSTKRWNMQRHSFLPTWITRSSTTLRRRLKHPSMRS